MFLSSTAVFAKYAGIILCSSYVVKRLVNKCIPITKMVQILLLALTNALIVCVLRVYARMISLPAMVAVSIGIHTVFLGLPISTAITATTIGYGTVYICFFAAIVIFGVILRVLPVITAIPDVAQSVIIGSIEFGCVVALFKIKRFSHGLPFLSDLKYGDFGVYLSISILSIVSFLGGDTLQNQAYVAFIYLLFLCAFFLVFWYRRHLAEEYRKKLLEREQGHLLEQIAQLQQENEVLSSIIHKDNKLIPALDLSVKEFLLSAAQDDDKESRIRTAQVLLAQIERISADRMCAVTNYQQIPSPEIKTSIPIIDALFSFMLYRASQENIQLKITVSTDIHEMLEKTISEQDASTILADLMENALIAIKQRDADPPDRMLAINLGCSPQGFFSISSKDTGVPFLPKVLTHLGQHRITTHADSGGSGIGMMTICELCRKYHASLLIDQSNENAPYTKTITIEFDQKETRQF